MAEINPVLVVVDVQNGFVTEHSKHVVPVVAQLGREWLGYGRDVLFTRCLNYDDSLFETIMGWSQLKVSPETAVDAFERGLRAWIGSDASASHSGDAPHAAGLTVAEKMPGRRQTIERATMLIPIANRSRPGTSNHQGHNTTHCRSHCGRRSPKRVQLHEELCQGNTCEAATFTNKKE